MDLFSFLSQRKTEHLDAKGLLYHYTSVDVLEKFLDDNGDFYCTNFQTLNDRSELMTGMALARKYLCDAFKWSETTSAWFQENYNIIVSRSGMIAPWIMSFSQERDSLNQWGMYTSREKGGVAIGFERGNLWNAIDRLPGSYSDVNATGEKGEKQAFELRLLPCLYSQTDLKLINELFEERFKPLRDIFKRIGDAESSSDVPSEDFSRAICAILEISTIIKHEAFSNEKEERLIVFPLTEKLADCKLIGGKPRWKAHVRETLKEGVGNPKYKFLRGMIKEIVVSPHGDAQMIWTTVRFLLDKYGMDWCRLETSALPFCSR